MPCTIRNAFRRSRLRRQPWLRDGACTFLEDPDSSVLCAYPFWRAEHDPRVVLVDAVSARTATVDLFDLTALGVSHRLVRDPMGRERLLLKEDLRMIRLDVRSGTLDDGPVLLRFALEGTRDLGFRLLTLRRLVGLRRLGRFPSGLFRPERRVPRWILMLRALDARAAGASHRAIAEILYDSLARNAGWRQGSEALRLRVQRLVQTAVRSAEKLHLTVLRGRPPL